MQRNLGYLPTVFVLLLVVGCGDRTDIASVEGVVTMDDKPLPDASVMFVPPGGRPAGAMTDANGKYELNFSQGRKGAIPGLNKVKISTAAGPYTDAEGNNVASKPETIPVEYNQQSTLEFNVEDGKKNVANFELKSGGRIATDTGGY